jgi:peroxiredoxin/predicted negative regulator of RcsB-dependent stress response
MIQYVLLFAVLLIFTPVTDAISISLGESAPDFTLTSAEGKAVTIGEYKGKTLVLIFWRTGQKRSLLALKEANEISNMYGAKEVKVIGVIQDSENQEDARALFEEHKIDFPLLIDKDRQAYSDYGIRVFPTTVIIDGDGKLAYDIPSHPLTYKNTLEGYVRRLIGEIDEEELKNVLSPRKEEKDEAVLEAERRYDLAMKFVQMRMLDQAISAAIKSIEAKSDMAKSHVLLGFLYLNSGEADNALAAFDKALALTPDANDAKTGKGGALIMKGEVDSAIEILNEAAVANPYAQMTYYELGKAYERKGDKDKSLEMYKKAIEKIIQKNILPSSVANCQ